jgi:hypothetical protein
LRHKNHINSLFRLKVEVTNIKLLVHKVTIGMFREYRVENNLIVQVHLGSTCDTSLTKALSLQELINTTDKLSFSISSAGQDSNIGIVEQIRGSCPGFLSDMNSRPHNLFWLFC